MCKLYYSPAVAARYVGEDGKEFAASLGRPKPILNHGDIVITDNRTAYNLINKGFGQYEAVESIEIPDYDELVFENEHLKIECERLKGELAKALEFLNDDDETVNTDEVPPVDDTTATADEVPPVDDTTATADEVPPVDDTTATADEVPPVDDTTATADEVPPVDDAATADEVPPVDEAATADEVPPVDDAATTDEVPPVDAVKKPRVSRGKNPPNAK